MQFLTGSDRIDIDIEHLVVAGWTGRDTTAVQHHIDELGALGVAPPSMTPLFYRVSNTLLTQQTRVQMLSEDTSGEAEPLVIRQNGKLWLGLASDHTDRALEATSVAASKQACAKVCAADLWPFETVQDHLDRLTLRSWIHEGGDWSLYQDGNLEQILPLAPLSRRLDDLDPAAMLCGTLPALGGVRPAPGFRAELADPVLGKVIRLEYAITCLPVVR